MEKTDTSRSPLLKPVIERDYTKGGGFDLKPPGPQPKPGTVPGESAAAGAKPGEPGPQPKPGANFERPADDFTRPFSFDEDTERVSDLHEGEGGPGVTIPMGSAKTFANFVGNAIQLYLPKATYGYVKIDIDNAIINVEKGYLLGKWVDTFREINKNTEEALKIPDESIKMWKAAFKDYLEYKQMKFANPETAFWAATVLLITDQGVRAYSIKKQNEKFMRDALEESNPGLIIKKGGGTQAAAENNQTNNRKDEGAKAA